MEPEDRISDILEYVKHIDRPHSESDTFYVVGKYIVQGENKYYLTASFCQLIQILQSFFNLIFKKKVAAYHLSLKMVDLVMVA